MESGAPLLLIVEDDTTFCELAQKVADAQHIEIKTVRSIDAAKRTLPHLNYSGVLIAGRLPDGKGLDLVRWIRSESGLQNLALAFLSSSHASMNDFENLKAKGLDYILTKPIDPELLKTVFSYLLFGGKQDRTDIEFGELKDEYRAKISTKLRYIEDLNQKIEADQKSEHLINLQSYLRRLSGNAAYFGYMGVSSLCKRADNEIQGFLNKQTQVNHEWLFALFNGLKTAFQFPDFDQEIISDTSKEAELSDLKEYYIQKIPEKKAEIRAALDTYKADPTAENLSQLKRLIHKLGGSSGSYGFQTTSMICRGLDKSLENVESFEVASLEKFYQDIEASLEVAQPEAKLEPSTTTIEQQFTKSLSKKIEIFSDLRKRLQEGFDIELLKELQRELHKLTGSAGSFGHMELSQISRTYENQIQSNIDTDHKEFDAEGFDKLSAKINETLEEGHKRESESEKKHFLVSLRERYQDIFPQKIEQFRLLIQFYTEFPTKENLQQIHIELHKLSGSAGSYGYSEISTLCKEMTGKLEEYFAKSEVDEASIQKELWQVFEKIKISYEIGPTQVPHFQAENADRDVEFKPDIFLIDDDDDFISLLKKKGEATGLEIESQGSIENAMARLEDPTCHPKLILIAKEFDQNPEAGFEMIRKIRQKGNGLTLSHLAMISPTGDLPDRIEALGLGVSHFFQKPIDLELILSSLSKLTKSVKLPNFKVMLIDDDPDFCAYMEYCFKNQQIEFVSFQEGSKLFKHLQEEQPDLLLLDIDIPEYNGFDLLQTIRADIAFQSLPIMIVSSHDDPEILQKAYQFHVFDYLIKPVTEDQLFTRLENVLSQFPASGVQKSAMQLPALLTSSQIPSTFHILKQRYSVMSFAVLSLNFFKTNILKSSQQTIFEQFAKHVSQSFRDQDVRGTWADDSFIIIMPNLRKEQAERLIFSFFDDMKTTRLFKQYTNLSVNAGISCFPANGVHFQHLVEISSEAEQKLRRENHDWNVLRCEKEFESKLQAESNVLIIEGDQEMLEMLDYAYHARGYDTTAISTGSEAIDWMKDHLYHNPPQLIILDGSNLPDLEEPDNLHRMKQIVGDSIPLIFISSINQEENILRRLNEGADEYITKPFSLSILMEKSQHLLM